jgi:GNAT superfamily N-acetyltransferase
VIDGPRLTGGLSARPATPDDATAITALVAACELAADGASEIDRTDIEHDLGQAAVEPPGAIVVEEVGHLVAWAILNGQRIQVDVHPERRGRGIGSALLDWAEATARVRGLPRIRQVKTDHDRAAAALFADRGFEVGHAAWILAMQGRDDTSPVAVPAGIALRAYRAADGPATYRLIDDAFNEWPEREPVSFDQWHRLVIDHGAFSPALSRLAFDGDELVGVALAFDYGSVGEGWVQQLATKASHRHRGIARALLGTVFAAFREEGRRTVGLSTDSRTGALSLYERLGMRIRRSYTNWIKEL